MRVCVRERKTEGKKKKERVRKTYIKRERDRE